MRGRAPFPFRKKIMFKRLAAIATLATLLIVLTIASPADARPPAELPNSWKAQVTPVRASLLALEERVRAERFYAHVVAVEEQAEVERQEAARLAAEREEAQRAEAARAAAQATATTAPPSTTAPAAPGTTSPPATAPAPAPAPAPSAGAGVWDRLAQCESGGNWAINTGNGYYGGLQFSAQSWRAVGGTGLPHQHSREVQIAAGERLKAIQGWGAWPSCSRQLGLR